MKRTTYLFLTSFLILIVAALLSSCRGPEGPQGPSGESTVVNLEGFAPDINCGNCHNPDQDSTYYVWAKKYQWERSKHAIGGDYERNSSSCAGCHTTEGFVKRMQGKPVTNQVDSSPPGCFACHAPHANGDFALRNVEPVTISSNITGVPNASFDFGKGNLCVQCHMTRNMTPKPDPTKGAATDSIVITTSRWYSHYGVQGQMLMGDGGFKFPGFTYTGNSPHSSLPALKQEGCISCHMADATAGSGIAGGHTMNLRYEFHGAAASLLNGCNQSGCHASITTLDYKGVQTAVHANLDTLQTLLINKGWLEGNPASANYLQAKLTGGRLVIKPANRSGALYNYFFIEHDLSQGVHNTKYALELLRSSIEELRKP
jgi:hypothetical protein